MRTIRCVINRWDTAEALASDIGQKGVTVRQWRNRNAIPSRHWFTILDAAQRRGFRDITPELLARIHARPEPSLGQDRLQRDGAA